MLHFNYKVKTNSSSSSSSSFSSPYCLFGYISKVILSFKTCCFFSLEHIFCLILPGSSIVLLLNSVSCFLFYVPVSLYYFYYLLSCIFFTLVVQVIGKVSILFIFMVPCKGSTFRTQKLVDSMGSTMLYK